MRQIKNEYVFLSAQLKNLTPAINERRHETLITMLDDLKVPYSVTSGYYDGFTETSVMIRLEPYKGFDEAFFADIACKNFSQESILYVDKENHARLIYEDRIEYLGEISRITQSQASKLDAFTWIPETNTYLGVL
jgi:hypothetical protein